MQNYTVSLQIGAAKLRYMHTTGYFLLEMESGKKCSPLSPAYLSFLASPLSLIFILLKYIPFLMLRYHVVWKTFRKVSSKMFSRERKMLLSYHNSRFLLSPHATNTFFFMKKGQQKACVRKVNKI